MFGFFARRRRAAELRDRLRVVEAERNNLLEQNERLLLLVSALRDVNGDLDRRLIAVKGGSR
jgi:hypothetical protein